MGEESREKTLLFAEYNLPSHACRDNKKVQVFLQSAA
jgi:hypothetical protein